MPRALAATLRISVVEANRRVRAAEALAERASMFGETLPPARPQLAGGQRDGTVSAEQADIVERALGKVSGGALTRPRWSGRRGTSPRLRRRSVRKT